MFNKHKGPDFLIAQVYVDDIIFGGSLPALVTVFVEQMKFEFELSIMGGSLSSWDFKFVIAD